jgi:hypothetical protein
MWGLSVGNGGEKITPDVDYMIGNHHVNNKVKQIIAVRTALESIDCKADIYDRRHIFFDRGCVVHAIIGNIGRVGCGYL